MVLKRFFLFDGTQKDLKETLQRYLNDVCDLSQFSKAWWKDDGGQVGSKRFHDNVAIARGVGTAQRRERKA